MNYILFETFCFVEIPQEAKEFNLFEVSKVLTQPKKYLQYLRDGFWQMPVEVPYQNWELLAVSDEVDRFKAEKIVAEKIADTYRDYEAPTAPWCVTFTSLASYASLIRAAGVKYGRYLIIRKIQ